MKQEGSHLVGGSQTRLPATGTSDELHRADAEGNPEDRGTSPFRQFLAWLVQFDCHCRRLHYAPSLFCFSSSSAT